MQPDERSISVGTLRLHVRDWGGPIGAPPILLVHGLASNARIWDLVAPDLIGTFRVVALDQRGHGQSAAPNSGYDFATIVADLAGAIDALGLEHPLVVGHSWGANVALQLAADMPALPRGIVLVDGGTNELAALMTREEALERLAPPRLAGRPRAGFLADLRERWLRDLWRPEIEAIIMGNFSVDGQDRIAPHLSFENHLQVVQALWDQRPTALFARVACPVLIIPAEPPPPRDPQAEQWLEVKRASAEQAGHALRDARVVWAHASVHDIPLHHPAWLARQIATFAAELAGPQ